MADKLRVGVVGVGHLGQHHARIFSQSPKCELVAVVDRHTSRSRRIARQVGAQGFKHHERLFGRVDAVSIAVPTSLHYEVAAAFLERGIHCMVEKPITTTVEDAERLIALAEKNKCVLQVGHIERYNAAVRYLRDNGLLTQPGFIECHRLGPFTPRVADVGVVLDLMIHDIDIVLRLVDSPIESMDAVGVNVLTDKEDIANVRLIFKNGCRANLTASRVSPKSQRKIRVFQKDSYVSIDCSKESMELYQRVVRPCTGKGKPLVEIVRKRLRPRKEDKLTLELDDFLGAIIEGRPSTVPGEHARDALLLAVQIVKRISELKVHERFG